MRSNSIRVANKLHIASLTNFLPQTEEAKKVYQGTNVVFNIDVSGSMWGELPKIRLQLKNKLAEIMDPNDTVTIVWFSGSGQCGIVQELVKIKDLPKLKKMQDMVDKFIQPMGLTAFDGPIKLTKEVVTRIQKDNSNPINFIFLSDGYHNSGKWDDVQAAIDALVPEIDSTTIVEYGYYADSDRLSAMAETLGGTKIFSRDFDDYDAQITSVISEKVGKRIEVDITSIKSDLKYQFLMSYNKSTNTVLTYACDRKTVITIPEGVKELYAITTDGNDKLDGTKSSVIKSMLYAVNILVDKYKFDVAEPIIRHLSIKPLLDQFSKAYGKQAINDLKDMAMDLAKTPVKKLELAPKTYKPSPKAYCILDLLGDLMEGDNLINIYSPLFNYSRTGAKRVARKILTSKDRAQLAKAKSANEVIAIADKSGARFKSDPSIKGYSLNNLVWNSDRANVSLQVNIPGKVILPANKFKLKEVESYIIRNYTIIKDGILNFSELPVFLDDATAKKLTKKIPSSLQSLGDNEYLIDLTELPLINKNHIEKIDLNKLAIQEVELLEAKADQKYINYLKKSSSLGAVKGNSEYTKEQLEFLKEQGIGYNGAYSPLTDRVEPTDFYLAPRLVTKIKSFSSLPAIEKVTEKILDNKKLTPSEELINSSIERLDKIAKNSKKLEKEIESNKKLVKSLIKTVATSKFSLIMSRKQIDETNLIEVEDYSVNFDYSMETVKI